MYLTKKIKEGGLIEECNKLEDNKKTRLLYSNSQLVSIGLCNESDPNEAWGAVESNQSHVVNSLWPVEAKPTCECFVCGEKLYGWDKVAVKHYFLCQLCYSDRLDLTL